MRATMALSVLLTFAGIWMHVAAVDAAELVYFEEQFNGQTVDPSVWRAELLIGGFRWCDVTAGGSEQPGEWVAPGGQCHGVAVTDPFGVAEVSGGLLTCSQPSGHTFPYLVSRGGSADALIPATGDFELAIRMRYLHTTGYGTGATLGAWAEVDPEQASVPSSWNGLVMQVWADPDLHIMSNVTGSPVDIGVAMDPLAFHEFTVRFEAGNCTVLVDGQLIYGPVPASVRPRTIAFGNPVHSWWGASAWSSFSIDYVRVTTSAPTSAAKRTWGALKSLH